MANRNIALIVATLTLIVITGCGVMFAPDRYASRTATKSELVGEWVLTDQSLKCLKSDGYAPAKGTEHKFELRDDGTVTLTSVRDDFTDIFYVDGSGTWEIHDDNIVRVSIDTGNWKCGYRFEFGERSGRRFLWQYHRDPDMWEFVEYYRKPN